MFSSAENGRALRLGYAKLYGVMVVQCSRLVQWRSRRFDRLALAPDGAAAKLKLENPARLAVTPIGVWGFRLLPILRLRTWARCCRHYRG